MEKKLNRNMQDKMIGGVAGGLADYLDIDVTIVRVLLVLAVIFHGAGLLVYVVLWVAIPAGPDYPSYPQQTGGFGTPPPGSPPSAGAATTGDSPLPGAQGTVSGESTAGHPPFQGSAETPPFQAAHQQASPNGNSSGRSGALIGWILVGLGVFFLADDILPEWFHEFYYWFNFSRLWPLIFVVVGAMIISSAAKKSPGNKPPEEPVRPPDVAGNSPGAGGGSPQTDENTDLNAKP